MKFRDEKTYPNKMYQSILVQFNKMSYSVQFLRCLYKIIRIIQMSVWYYFLPFLALLGSYWVPYVLQTKYGILPD